MQHSFLRVANERPPTDLLGPRLRVLDAVLMSLGHFGGWPTCNLYGAKWELFFCPQANVLLVRRLDKTGAKQVAVPLARVRQMTLAAEAAP